MSCQLVPLPLPQVTDSALSCEEQRRVSVLWLVLVRTERIEIVTVSSDSQRLRNHVLAATGSGVGGLRLSPLCEVWESWHCAHRSVGEGGGR